MKRKQNNVEVLLTYGWVRSTYAALRNLYKHGINVAVSDASRLGMCQFSRYKYNSYIYSNPYKTSQMKFIEDLCNILKKNNIQILIPSHDETEIIAKYRKYIENHGVIVPIHEYDILSLANNKFETIKLSKKLGINVPSVLEYKELESIDSHFEEYVIKLQKGNSAKGVFYAKNINEAKILYQNIIKNYNIPSDRLPIIQERVFGEGWGVSCLYWQGQRIAYFTHRRLREKINTGGTSTLRQAAANPILEDMAFCILDHLNWHGLAMVEFKYDETKKKGWFIEINPRMWGSIHLAIDSGVEFPYLLYLCCKGKADQAKFIFNNSKIKYGNIARWYLGDLIIATQRLINNEYRDITGLLRKGIENSYDDIFIDDPLVFLGEILNYSLKFIKYRSTNPVEEGTVG